MSGPMSSYTPSNPRRACRRGRAVAATGRQPNATYRIREHLTEHEMDQLLAALKRKRQGQRRCASLRFPHSLGKLHGDLAHAAA
jgi:hypothetical protein